jgi:MFS family permease
MFLGRFLFGCGETSTSVANSTMLSDWFEGKELAFSFAFNVAIARMGSVVNNVASPAIAASTGGKFKQMFICYHMC